MPPPEVEKLACLQALAAVANLNGDPTPLEFEAFLTALSTFQPFPVGITPEGLLAGSPNLEAQLSQITTPELQQQLYLGIFAIVRSKGIDPQEAAVLAKVRSHFQFSPELAQSLAKQPLVRVQPASRVNSTLVGMSALISREGEVRRLIFDYSLATAIVGLIPITGGGSLEIKLLVVLGLILKMIWDIRKLWGRPTGQDSLAIIGNMFGFLGAVVGGFLAWATLIGLGVVVPYAGAFAKAAGFATATWIAGQSTNQFYTSQKRPDLTALKRAFPSLMTSDQ
ncbi:MAG TPA: hypothetical protein IGR64_00025 [Leptolyngbyaceae cyanobacterium M65_K2018_010]|nr:hypothetical protein [Leptolyngbyaceae cyanobacterium M65_K2018_010]